MEKQFDKTAESRSLPEITAGSYQRTLGVWRSESGEGGDDLSHIL